MQCDDKLALSQVRLDRARECLADAKLLLDNGSYKALANRSYYAIFHAMRAVLVLDGYDSKKHSGIISEFQRMYIKTATFDKEYSIIIKKLLQARTGSDYDDFFAISKEDTVSQFYDAVKFVEAVEAYLNNIEKT